MKNLVVFTMCCLFLFVPHRAEAWIFTRSFSDDFGPVIGRPLDCASVVFWSDCFDPDRHNSRKRKSKIKTYRPLTEKEARLALRKYMPPIQKPRRSIRDPRIGR